MKFLRQLLQEFWVPLILGTAWTVFNFIDRPLSQWTAREVVNVFGPTFFFVSWLVAQWYRVRKQQRVEDGLTQIQQDIHAIQSPILPCALFITLQYEATDEDLHALFNGTSGYRAFGVDKPMPPPPVGLPPGVTNGRVIHQHGYIEYENCSIAAAGIYRLDHPGFNVIHRNVHHTVAFLPSDELNESQKRHHPILYVPSVRIEVHFGGRPKSPNSPPSVVLRSNSGPSNEPMIAVRALDSGIYVDHVLKLVPEQADQPHHSSTAALKGAYIRISLSLFYVEPVLSVPKESWPHLRNFQLWLGPGAAKILTFSPAMLEAQVVRENPDPIIGGQGRSVLVTIEAEIDADTYSKSFLSGR